MSADNRTFAIIAKPVGGACNLSCEYCYYAHRPSGIMSAKVLEAYISNTIDIHGKNAVVEFAWHGGEPLLAGTDFFRQAVALQKHYGKGRKITNTLQTNGTLLTDELCEFFAGHDFLIGISIDGPEELHNAYRKDKSGNGTFESAINGISKLQKHGVKFNTLTTINATNSKYPKEVYTFLREFSDYMQFLPVLEFCPDEYEKQTQHFALPEGNNSATYKRIKCDFSVTAEDFGTFLCEVFKLWKENDYGKKHVNIFDAVLRNVSGKNAGLCVHEPTCGHSLNIEYNGDVYSCDRYAYPQYLLGNILEESLEVLAGKNRRFGFFKTMGLCEKCLDCKYIRLCFGGCPKDRIFGHNRLCEGYKMLSRQMLLL